MRTYCIAQGTLTSALWRPKCEGNLKGEDTCMHMVDFPHRSVGKSCACSARDPGSVPESGRSPGEGNGNPLQYPCLENPMDRGA